MKQIKLYLFIILSTVTGGIGFFSSCTGMDDYLKYTDGKEIVYTGKVEYMMFRSGRERVVFTGYLISDPNIAKVSIYWNNRKDSLIIPVQRSAGVDILEEEIPLKEGTYNFEVYTFNKEGCPSVPSQVTGKSYGARYESSLYDRPIKDISQKDGYVLVEWYNADPTSFVELEYVNTGNNLLYRTVPASSDTTMLFDCKPESKIRMRTCYLPDWSAIDTFSVAPKWLNADADYSQRYLKNPGGPDGILGVEIGSGYGYPLDWIVSDEVKTDANRHGWSKTNKALHFESITGANITNGKVYQTTTLPPGSYTLSYNCLRGNPLTGNRARTDLYFLAVAGNFLPDFQNVENDNSVLSWYRLEASRLVTGERSIEFRLEEETEITLGFVMNFKENTSNYVVNRITLIYDAVF